MAKEDIKIRLPVVPELDRRSASKLVSDVRKLEKDLGKVNVSYKELAKTSALNIRDLKTLSSTAESFGKKLSKSAHDSVKELSRLGKHLENLSEKAEELEVQISGASDEAEKSKFQEQWAENAKLMSSLNKAIDKQRDQFKKFTGEFGRAIDQQKKFKATLEKAAEYGSKQKGMSQLSAAQQIFGGNFRGGIKGIIESTLKGSQGSRARKAIATGEKMGGPEGAAHMAKAGEKMASEMESMAMASAGLAAGAAAIAAFVKLILEASNHMTTLNKAVLQGKGLASEWGVSADQFAGSLKALRTAAIDSHANLIKFGLSSESAMEAVGAFGKEATGSLSKTVSMLKSMGGGNVQSGFTEFARNAQVYGSALGMTATETAKLMGTMVSDIGIDSDNVMNTMGSIVKQAAQAGMPVHKFMDIFHQAIPNLDLFTNRIEELTGMMKMLSKTMDPRQVKSFMQTMSRGFDQVDFKQRLKMNLMSGGRVAGTMKSDAGMMAKALKDQMPDLADAIDQALSGKRTFADVAAQAMAMGKSGAQVGKINDLGRYSALAGSGDVLKQTTGMRYMGMFARMKTLEDQAMALHGNKDLAGLGEHVAKMNGIGEDEYKSIVALRQSVDTYMTSINKIGRTSSKSINDNLRKMLRQDKRIAEKQFDLDSDPGFEAAMQYLAKQDPGGMEDMLKQASMEQTDQQSAEAEAAKKELMSMEDLQAKQVEATQSIGDKIENVIKVLLEKIYFIFNDVLGILDSLYTMLPSWMGKSSDATQKALAERNASARGLFGKDNQAGLKMYTDTNKKVADMLKNGASSGDILNSSAANMEFFNRRTKDPEEIKALKAEYRDVFKGVGKIGESQDANTMAEAVASGDWNKLREYLKQLNPEDAAEVTSRIALKAAKQMSGSGIEYTQQKTTDAAVAKHLAAKQKQQEIAAATGDLDKRAQALYGTGASGAATSTPAGASASANRQMTSFSRDTKDQTEAQQTTADATQSMADKIDKGVALDQTYTQGKLKNTLKDASLEALRKALGEQSIFEAMLRESPDWQSAVVGGGMNALASGASMADMVNLRNHGGATAAGDIADLVKGYADGGPTGSNAHLAMVHPSEFVVPKGGALVMKDGKGGRQVHVANMTINIQTNNPHEVRQAIDEAFNTGG